MKRSELSQIIRAAARILDDPHIVVIGSQSILASYPETTLPAELVMSIEADLLPRGGDDDADMIDGAIGEQSQGPGTGDIEGHVPRTFNGPVIPLVIGNFMSCSSANFSITSTE